MVNISINLYFTNVNAHVGKVKKVFYGLKYRFLVIPIL